MTAVALSVTARDPDGIGVLAYAVRRVPARRAEAAIALTIELLRAAFANFATPNRDGESALDHARKHDPSSFVARGGGNAQIGVAPRYVSMSFRT